MAIATQPYDKYQIILQSCDRLAYHRRDLIIECSNARTGIKARRGYVCNMLCDHGINSTEFAWNHPASVLVETNAMA